MHLTSPFGKKSSTPFLFVLAMFIATDALAQTPTNATVPTLQIQADHVIAKMPPTFYGLMTEEINYSYEGGLYGELIRNRSFKADAIPEIVKLPHQCRAEILERGAWLWQHNYPRPCSAAQQRT